ncbi:helix-turn-helix transcriptional regulator [Rhizobium sp. KVB221]|uniref:Helix-turn-helix transcriptional regulator n=1 Tax=Rhizobium setariae TaxID=2801340 RepID=A0A936YU61_9HYPH|nr:helix-turn-helix transcriptional regulator [Rhizobium setariae]MBL0373201.1 helix-turn-helix transcriptional regulator [Rhizobium setariae]
MKKLPSQLLEALHDTHIRNLDWIERSNADVLVHSSEDPGGYTVPFHHHRRVQLLCVFAGVVLVTTEKGRWMIPAGHALLIPAYLAHSVEMLSEVSMKSVYMFPRAGDAALPAPEVLEVTELARSLVLEAVRLSQAEANGRKADLVLQLLLEEIATLEVRPLSLPFPADRRLAELCLGYMNNPSPNARLDDWATRLAMSRRTFTRFFRKETGISFVTWRQQASVFACLPRLAEGVPVTHVALEAGYESVAAFTTMFRRMLGRSPRGYMAQRNAFDQD